MRRSAINLQLKHRFDGVHCRSYPASENGLYLKRRFGIKFIFDMRGFWADEKKDGGSWNIKNPLFRRIYRYYKFRESQFVSNADSIISLTEAGKIEMQKWSSYAVHVPLTVIPCCADMDHFTLRSQSVKEAVRKKLDIPHDVKVVSYLGSLGAWYMLEEMLGFFRLLKDRYPDALFLFISHSPSRLILSRLAFYGLAATDVRIVPAERADVPALAQAADVSVSFIRPVYSKISSSPTKLGELLVMGIPVVVNAGVGDVEQIVHSLDGGAVISDFTSNEFHRVLDDFPRLLTLNPAAIRSRAAKYYGLDIGVRKYAEVYDQLFNV
jgi:glycosyltransferase involved in cell wall biosynthesis